MIARMLLVLAVVAAAPVSAGLAGVASETFTCEDGELRGRTFWVYASGPGATCAWRPGGSFLCASAGRSVARGDCGGGCESYEGHAGCLEGAEPVGPIVPALDVDCGGTTYRLSDPRGRCARREAGAASTGGECLRRLRDGEIRTVKLSCETGCRYEAPGASCRCRNGCAGQ